MPYATRYSSHYTHNEVIEASRRLTRMARDKNHHAKIRIAYAKDSIAATAEIARRNYDACLEPDRLIKRYGTRNAKRLARAILNRFAKKPFIGSHSKDAYES